MHRDGRYSPRLAGTLALLLVLGSVSPAVAVESPLSTRELRVQFAECGFEIGNPNSVATNPYVVLRDPGAALVRDADYRIVMAIVYRDAETANTAHVRAHRQAEQRLGARWPFNDDNGPQLLTGYSGSVWRANVALVESSSRSLSSKYSYDSETDETRGARPDLLELGFAPSNGEYAVDRDFVACLEDVAPARGAPSMPSVGPNFLPGHPW